MVLLNYLLGSAKLAIWRTRKNRTLGIGSVDAERVLKGMVAARIKIEFAYFKLVNNIIDFSAIWSVGSFLCEVGQDGMLVLKI